MNVPAHVDLVQILLGTRPPSPRAVGEVPAAHFASPARFALEQERLFARLPSVVAADAELAERGACKTVHVAGVPLLVVRGDDGVVRAFRNACRHRGTELVPEDADAPCVVKKAFVCPYHAWTYDLAGHLIHVPHAASFCGADRERASLVPAFAAVKHGLVWAALAPFDVDAHTAPIAADLAAMDSSVAFRSSTRRVRANWKLLVDAFLDGYHIKHLHRASVARFFIDAKLEAEPAGDHIRALTARRTIAEVQSVDDLRVRDVATPSYVIFPATVVILHPDYTSVMRIEPRGVDETHFHHTMLLAAPPRDDAENAHFAKSFTLIDEGVFAREDLDVVERIQRGLGAGADTTVLYGELEHASLWFHDSIAAHLAVA